ncbi:hypothetical protein [Butyrivibrio fibrisolvens]|uniref:hypothetical protein n=1 Tax=Butyrivibrio fibrisolvens TaxID=831 RepID=UPI000406CC3F|nr:hypothetical protein [Butyrivibrio fibrisolvens]
MKNKRNIIYTSIILLILLSFIPVFYLFSYCFATGDDYGYSAAVKYAWYNSHSIIDIIRASINHLMGVYRSWQGTWYTVFLFTLNPEVFGFGYYILTPVIMFTLHILSAWLLVKTFFNHKYFFSKIELCLTVALLLFCNIQFAPSYQCNLFWWVGTVHYVVPFFTGCLALYNSREFLRTYRIRNYIVAFIAFTLIGGGNYQIAIITPLVLLCSILWDIIINKNILKKKAWILVLPIIFEMLGLFISTIAPGNKNRGGEKFGFSIIYALKVILKCFVEAFNTIVDYSISRTAIIAIFLIYAVITYKIIRSCKNISTNSFKSPFLMILMTFCLFAASFAPALYADVGVSGGVFNTSFYIFVISMFYDIAYLEGFFISKYAPNTSAKSSMLSKLIVYILLIVIVYIGRHSLKLSTTYVSYSYITSGQADDYKEQILLQYAILSDNDNSTPIVPFINNEQGPLQHMPVTDNPDAWTNTVTAMYYNKKSVQAIDRETWFEEYGSIYGY